MMIIKYLLCFLVISCGPNIELKNKLEKISLLTPSQEESFQKEGILTKSSQTRVFYDGKSYLVSQFSSKESELFISSLPQGAHVPIIFTGGVSAHEVVLETVKRK